MKTLGRVISVLRGWMGWVDIEQDRLSPDHGWLLPTPTVLNTLRVPAELPSRVDSRRAKR
jgi:hypothetical protein